MSSTSSTPVELDVFSGRPNPRWELGPRDAARLRAMHRELTRSGIQLPGPPALGYRGMVYEIDGRRWRAWGGALHGSDGVWLDTQRGIERFLVGTMPIHYAALRDRLSREPGLAPPENAG